MKTPWATAMLACCLGATGAAQESGSEEPVFKRIGDTELKMRVYKPAGWKAGDKRPGIVFFFGGGWRGGSTKQFHQHCLHLAQRGFVAMAAEYRIKSLHDSTPIDSTMDAKSAIRWARSQAATLGLDPARLAAGGGSAGGHLAAATATIGDAVNDPRDDLSVSAVPDALVLFNPAVNLMLPKLKEMLGDEIYARIESISPAQHVSAKLPPTIVFHGTADEAVPFETVEAFVNKAKDLGASRVTLEAYEGRPHGFFNFGRGDGKDFPDTLAKMDRFFIALGWMTE